MPTKKLPELERRLERLERSGGLVRRIETLADYVLWRAHGRPRPVEFDAGFTEWILGAYEKARARQKDSETENHDQEM